MQSLIFGAAVAVALAALGSDASAGLADGARRSLSPAGGTVHAGMTLAKAKKKGRRPAASGGKASAPDDTGDADDEAPSKSSAGSSGASDDAASEEELLGAKKKRASAPVDDGSSSDDSGKEAPKASPKSVETVESKASDESGDASPSPALEFGVGAKALFRQFSWTSDARAVGLGPYTLSPGPETGMWLEFYPAAFGTSGFAANVGIFGRFDYGFGVATTLANGDVVSTKFRDFLAGLKVRVPMGTFIPNASIAYGSQTFEIAQQGTAQDLPQLAYAFIRPALGTRVMFAPTVAMDVAAAYLMVLDPGSGAGHVRAPNFFPDATSAGFEVSASVGFRLTGSIGARTGVELRQYALNMNDKTAPTVGGAVDRYITAWAGLEVVLDGLGGAAGGDDEPVKPSKRKRRHAEPKPSSEDSSSEDSAAEDE